MANDVVWYHSDETGAPVLNNAAGSLDAVLYACLVTGFNSQTVTSVVVAGEVATVTKAGHGFTDQAIVEMGGAATGAINGRKLATVTGSGTFTFPAPGVADGTISGTITAKRAPLGWTRDKNSGNVSIYKRSDPTATAMGLRIDDTAAGVASASYARVRMLEAWTDVNSFTGPAPTDAQVSGGLYWPKGANSATAKPWVLVGDGKTFYLFTDGVSYPASSYSGLPNGILGFGDLASYRAGDAYCCWLSGSTSAADVPSGTGVGSAQLLGTMSGSYGMTVARLSSTVGGPVTTNPHSLRGTQRFGGSGPVYPSPVDNGMVLATPVLVGEINSVFGNPIRGELRGVADPLASLSSGALASALHRQILSNVVGSSRRWFCVGYQQQANFGVVAFDATGPWA